MMQDTSNFYELDDSVSIPHEVWKEHKNLFAIGYEGEGMNLVIPNGSHVFFDPDLEPRNDSVVLYGYTDDDGNKKTDMGRLFLPGDFFRKYFGESLPVCAIFHENYENDGQIMFRQFYDDDDFELFGVAVWFQSSPEQAANLSGCQGLMDDGDELKECCICGKPLPNPRTWNNPYPVSADEDDVCCSECNATRVIPARLRQAARGKTD